MTQPKHFTDWTPDQLKRYKARGIVQDLYAREQRSGTDLWNLPSDVSMSLHVTLLPDEKILEYVTSAGYIWDGENWMLIGSKDVASNNLPDDDALPGDDQPTKTLRPFKTGDRVQLTQNLGDDLVAGDLGSVVLNDKGDKLGVAFDRYMGGGVISYFHTLGQGNVRVIDYCDHVSDQVGSTPESDAGYSVTTD